MIGNQSHSSQKDLEKANGQGRTLRAENANLRIENDEYKRELRDAEMRLEAESSRVQSLEATVRECQAVQLKSVESTSWMPHARSDIQHQLESIQTQIRQWAKQYSKISFEDFMQSHDLQRLSSRLVVRGCAPSEEKLLNAILDNETMRKPGRASGLLLGAVISIDILTRIIQNPFFAFEGKEEEDHLLNGAQGSALRGLTKLIRKSDETGAEGLRCHVLRLLDPASNDKDPRVAIAKKIASNSRTFVARRMARDMVVSVPSVLGGVGGHDALSSLQVIFEEAAELSWSLWTRKARMRIEIPRNGEFEYHSLHLRELDDDPKFLDGKEEILLCDATVVMYGDAEGQDFHKRHVVKKAVLWMG
ncbi:uncharacterized protein RCC_07896 [Ramularia collo-cygni]|uniref:Uncharacterized protein n=1 Tax=Ramularia collo-cygni TaxID=112498 RepID=A0A2D3VB35_9PEZI|nr:uncharacterized protein RCC_07896 [Ramularia collo-cygni]CZT22027.1 uncharacterized protein RCC_07896 [Ramularia collo-cygni]